MLIERFSLSTPLSTITGMPLIIFFFSTIPMGYDHLLTDDDGKKKKHRTFQSTAMFSSILYYSQNKGGNMGGSKKALQLLVLTDLLSSPRDKIVPVQKWVDTWSQVRSVSHMSIRITGIASIML